MRNRFVPVENVARFTDAVDRLESRGAREKQIILLAGQAGLGKSRTALWWGLHKDAVLLTCKPAMSPGWLLRDLLKELNRPAPHRVQDAYEAAVLALIERPRPVVIDEVEDALSHDARALDTMRKLIDMVEVPLILVGRERTPDRILRQPQIASRVAGVAEFQPLTLDDIQLVIEELVEGEVAEEVAAKVQADSAGYIREVMTAVAEIDLVARRKKGGTVTLTDLGDLRLAGPMARGSRLQGSKVVALRGGARG